MLYFARHREVVAGVAPEAAPLESFGVEEHHCVARLATVSARTGPGCRAHPCLLLSATAKAGGAAIERVATTAMWVLSSSAYCRYR